MERNTKSFISILIICLLSVCALLPLFSVTTSATPSYTDADYYRPNGSVDITFHVSDIVNGGIDSTNVGDSFLHFSPTTFTGDSFTWSEFGTYTSWDGASNIVSPLYLNVDLQNEDSMHFDVGYTQAYQYANCRLTTSFDNLIEMDITLRDFYVFDEYFDDVPSTITESIDFSLSTNNEYRIFSSQRLGSAYYRYRQVGDALYSDVISMSSQFNPSIPSIIDSDGNVTDLIYDDGASDLRIAEFSNLSAIQEDTLYHFDYLTLTYYIDPFDLDGNLLVGGGTLEFYTEIIYTDVVNIDNIVITSDKTNIHIPPRDLGSWLGKATTGFFSAEFIPGFSFGGLVVVVLSFALLIWFLKLFAGG